MKRVLLLSVVLAACAPPEKPTPVERLAIVIAEKSWRGARLVGIDEHGDRQFEVIYGPKDEARETHPAISPDGRSILYTSTRIQHDSFETTSVRGEPVTPDPPWDRRPMKLWLAQIGNAMNETQLTHGPSIETTPVWALDGESFVFATTAETGTFDLYRGSRGRSGRHVKTGPITHGAGHEVSPSFAPDGSIVYASAALDSYDSHLERIAPDGTITQVTVGPNEGAPAVSPDGNWIAYTCRQTLVMRADGEPTDDAKRIGTIQHRDLCVRPFAMRADSTESIAPIVSLPPSDEDGPVWSRDGRYLFATSSVWGENGVIFSSVIFIDMQETPKKARILLDHGGAAPRMTPAIATSQLISADLAQNPEYLSTLARIMAKRIQQQIREEQAAP